MPKRVLGRAIAVETQLRARIVSECEQRGISVEKLHDLLVEVGCAIPVSGLYRLRSGDRAITVDELAAFAAIFDLSIPDLLDSSDAASRADRRREIKAALAASVEAIEGYGRLRYDEGLAASG